MEKKIKKIEDKPRKKYEFKSEKTKKRIISSTVMGLAVAAVVCALSFGCYKLYASKNTEGLTRNATPTCKMPYSMSNCKYARNTTVKKIQEMLYNRGYLTKTKDYNDGNFGSKTQAAVVAFQKSQKISADGFVGPDTLERLAKLTNTSYFKISYNKNGGSGNLNSSYKNVQVALSKVSTPISSTKLTKTGTWSTHVGYKATKQVNGKTSYILGCTTSNCVASNAKWFSANEFNKTTHYYFIYPLGRSVSETGANKQTVIFTAAYCKANQTYSQAKSACVKNSTTKQDVTNSSSSTASTNKSTNTPTIVFVEPSETEYGQKKILTIRYKYTGPDGYISFQTYNNFKENYTDCYPIKNNETKSFTLTLEANAQVRNAKVAYHPEKYCVSAPKIYKITKTYVYDLSAPTITKACKKDGYAYISATENGKIAQIGLCKIINNKINCKNEKINKKSISNYKIALGNYNTNDVVVQAIDSVGLKKIYPLQYRCK